MNQTVTIPIKTIDEIFSRLDELTKTVRKISTRLFKPRYGSDEWWEKEIEEGLEEVKLGKVRGPFKNANELINSLHQFV